MNELSKTANQTSAIQFLRPPKELNYEGQPRRVGYEFEFTGLTLERMGQIIVELLGGRLRRQDEFVYEVRGTRLGDFKLESDSTFLKEREYMKPFSALGIEFSAEFQHRVDETIAEHSDVLVPNEIVAPPILLKDMALLEELRRLSCIAISASDKSSLTLAPCGLQLNPEAYSLDAAEVLDVVRAFCLSYERLKKEIQVSLTRQAAPYIDPYAKEYVRLIMDPDYRPDFSRFAQDYFRHNPTRNKALDLAPLIGFVDESLLQGHEGLELSLIKTRPTFHYRLPNCRLEDPTWRLAHEWNAWVHIEELALDKKDLLARMERFNESR